MSEIKFAADSGGGTISWKGPATTTGNAAFQLTLPVNDGAANQVLTTNGSGALTWGAAGGGKVLQIVQATHNSAVTDTSGSYTDTGLTCDITTSASGHAGVFIIANLAVGATANNGGDAYVGFNLLRATTSLRTGMCGGWQDNLSGHTHVMYWQPAMNYYDTGTSAATTYTYKCQFKKNSDAVNAFAQNSTQGASYIHLVEIGS